MTTFALTLSTQVPWTWHEHMYMGMNWFWWTFWILVLAVLITPLWRSRDWSRTERGDRGVSAEEVLRIRFARGEIDDQEYARRLDVLRGTQEQGGAR